MVNEELKKNPDNPNAVNGEKREALFSPRFKSVAAMAGWDEEALLMASFVVEETPDRGHKQKKLPGLKHFVTPPTNSRRKRRAQKTSPASIRVAVIDLDDDDDTANQVETEKKKLEQKFTGKGDNGGVEASEEKGSCKTSSGSAILCIDKLREELSCAICLDICFEPSTTPCGHSFCRKCLQSAADKCGMRCPKCRQVISNGRSCIVNRVLWNSIQLLFPKEVEARKAVGALNNREAQHQNPARNVNHSNISRSRVDSGSWNPQKRHSLSVRRQNVRPSGTSSRNGDVSLRTQRQLQPSQDEDAALAQRLQREEYTETFRTRRSDEQYRNALALARANLRAMASTSINNIRARGRGTKI